MDSQRERLLTALPALLRELAASGVTELEVSYGDSSLYLRQRPGATPPLEGDGAPAASDAPLEEGLAHITAPLAGVFYGAASPDEPPFVSEGEAVEEGRVRPGAHILLAGFGGGLTWGASVLRWPA